MQSSPCNPIFRTPDECARTLRLASERRGVPVMTGLRCTELAGPERVKQLLKSPNVVPIRRRKDNQVVELQVQDRADDSRVPAHQGNPLKYTFLEELESSAPIHTLKRLPDFTRPIFRAVLESCAA
jgi:hypothetical protein